MRKVLYILGGLEDADIDWMVSAGRLQSVFTGTPLIHEGQPLDTIFIVLDGTFSMWIADQPETPIAHVGPGEVLGEISMLDSRPPVATVKAAVDSQVMSIRLDQLREKLESDHSFAARFYRALATLLAHRMRSRTQEIGPGQGRLDEDVETEDEIEFDLLDDVALAGKRFEWILNRLKGR